MGCFNIQDAITKNSIQYGDKVKFMFITNVNDKYSEPAVYITDKWAPISTIFEAEYDDYGSVENVVQSPALKVFEDYMCLNIDQILEIIRDNNRSPYSSCSPIMKIFKENIVKDVNFFSYDDITIEKICACSDKFNINDENYLKYTESDRLYYTFDFNFEEEKVKINQYNLNFNDKKFYLSSTYNINFKHRNNLSYFFEKVYNATKFLFLFDTRESVIIEKLLKIQLCVFSKEVFDYILGTEDSRNSRKSIIKSLEWKLDDNDYLYRFMYSNHYDFKRVYTNDKLQEIESDYIDFRVLINFLTTLNIEITPSNYASQQTFRKEEHDFHLFCANEALRRLNDEEE